LAKSVTPKIAKAPAAKPAAKPVAKPPASSTSGSSSASSSSSASASSTASGTGASSSSTTGTGNSASGGSIKSEFSQPSSGNSTTDLVTPTSESLPNEEQELRSQALSTNVAAAYEDDTSGQGGKQIENEQRQVETDQRDVKKDKLEVKQGQAEVQQARAEVKNAGNQAKSEKTEKKPGAKEPQGPDEHADKVAAKKDELELKQSEQRIKNEQREVSKEERKLRREERKAKQAERKRDNDSTTPSSNFKNGNTDRLELGPVTQRLKIEPNKADPSKKKTDEKSDIMRKFEEFQKNLELDPAKSTKQTDKLQENKQLSPIEQQRAQFLEAMQSVGPERLERMQKMMDKFESRMDDRGEARMAAGLDEATVDGEIEDDVKNTYKHLTELVSAPNQNGQVFDQDTRKFLAENFMLHAADPTTMDQGSNSSCWLEAGTIVGMINSPDAMARYTSEVARTSSFKDSDGRQHQFNQGIFGLGHEERNWSIARSGQSSARSPIGKLFDEGMSAMVGRRTPNWGSFYGSQGSREIMRKVTGKTFSDSSTLKNGSERQTLLLDGGYCNYQPSHVKTVQLSKRDDSWYIVQDNQWGESQDYIKGKVNGDLSQWNVSSMSNRFNHFNPDGPDQNLGPVGPAFQRRNDDYSPGPGPGPFRNFFDNFQNDGPNVNPFGPVPDGPVNYSDGMQEKLDAMTESGELTEEEVTRLKSYLQELTEKGVSPELQEQFLPQLIVEVKAETAAAQNQQLNPMDQNMMQDPMM
jgi:hypothetical protein